MKPLKALINKNNLHKFHGGSNYGKYLNSYNDYICITSHYYLANEIADAIGEETDDNCNYSYWYIGLTDLKEIAKIKGIESYGNDLYVYAIERKAIWKIQELTNFVDDWNYEQTEFMGWPRIDIDELLKLK